MLCNKHLEKKSLFLILFVLLSFTSIAKSQTKDITEGSLEVMDDKGKPVGLCPLKHTDVKVEVSGFIARVTVTQQFVNPFDRKIEAVYAFPLSEKAAVDDMTMIIGERVIRGKIMKREEAAAVYAQAKSEGKAASLLEQQRPNIFTQSVANIVPNAEVKIVISYVEYLKYDSGSYEFVFPMTIGERYIPMSQEINEDVSKISTSHSVRPGHTISLEAKINAGVPLVSLDSRNHKIEANAIDANESLIRLENQNDIPNKDFVLRYKVAGEKIQDALLTHKDGRGGFFTLILQPPERVMPQDVNPKEIVFVLDTSGSMGGFPIEKSKECMMLALEGLYPGDTFNLITFAGETSILFDEPVPATPENLSKAKKFLSSRKSDGGTEMMKAIKAALEPSDAQNHVRIVCFMTDGYVYNDNEIIAEVQKHPNARVFSFGIGSSVNRFLLDKIAEEGRGEAEYVSPNDDGSAAAKKFHERIRNPLLTDVLVDWNGLPVADVYPKRNPDLFSAKPVILSGRFTGSAKGVIRLKGMMAGNYYEREIPVEFPEEESSNDVLATLWARQRVDDLMKNDYAGAQNGTMKDELKNELTQIGIEFRLLTQFTSFVAVDETSNTGGDEGEKVAVPASIPDNAPTVGGVAETVTVTSGSYALYTSTSTTVTQQAIVELPIQGRNTFSLAGLATNASTTNQSRRATDFSVNGQRATGSTVLLDGSESVDNFTTGVGQTTPHDSVSEYKVVTGNLSAEYGRASGGVVNVTTKSGTNSFHGSLFDYFGNGALNANNFFANSRGLEKPSGKLNIFGGTLGGPIKRDKNFFFVAYEGNQMRQPAFLYTEVPSLSSRLNAPANLRSILNAFPIPTGANTANGFSEFSSTFLNPVSHNAFSFRNDLNITEKLQLNARYNFANSNMKTRGDEGFSLNTIRQMREQTNTLDGKLTYIMSPTIVAEFHATYNHLNLSNRFFTDNFGGANTVNLQTFFANAQTFTKFDFFGKNAVLAEGQKTENTLQQLEIGNEWSAVKNVHTLHFGFNYRGQWFATGTQPNEKSFLFGGASLTNSNAARANLFSRAPKLHPRFTALSTYINDEWRVRPNITLNLGLRWEISLPPSNSDDVKPLALSDFNEQLNISPVSNNTSLWRTAYNNFAPRAGFSWDIKNDGKMVLRGGFGIYYEMDNTANVLQAFNYSYPFVTGTVAFNQPFTSNPATQNNLLVGFNPKLKLPYTRSWTLAFDREVFSNTILSFDYTGTQGRRLYLTRTLLNQNADFNMVRLVSNEAESDFHSINLKLTKELSRGFTANFSYSFSKSLDNYSQDSPFAAMIVSDNPRLDRGASDFDARHTFNGFVSYSTPNEATGKWFSSLIRRWTFTSLFNLRTALPVNVVYARVNGFGVAYLRPDLRLNNPLYLDDANIGGGQQINANAFSIPASLRQGTLGRNSLRGFLFYQVDMSVSRTFTIKQDLRLILKLSAINVLNHPNFAAPIESDLSMGTQFPTGEFLSNPVFGRATSMLGSNTNASLFSLYQQNGARSLQLSFKLQF